MNKQGFINYLKSNKNNLNISKLKGLDNNTKKSLYNEWLATGSIPKSYFKQNNGISTTNNFNNIKQSNGNINTNSLNNIKQSNGNINTNSFTNPIGEISQGNLMANKLAETGKAFETQQKIRAEEIANANKASAEEQKAIIEQKNIEARKRYADQKALLDKNQKAAEDRIAQSKTNADNLLRRQEEIAARQANIGAGIAGASGLQMSEGDILDIKNDIIAKYGNNISNAEQFRNQTHMSLNDSLTKIAGDIFTNKQQIDNFLNNLDDEEIKPLLNASAAALEGNVQAINSVKDYYNKIIQSKADEEYKRFAENERYADNEREWKNADRGKKIALLQSALKDLGLGNLDPYLKNSDKFENMSFIEAVSTIAKDVSNSNSIRDTVNTAISQGVYNNVPDFYKTFTENFGKEGLGALDRLNATAEQKKGNVPQSQQMINKINTNVNTSKNTNVNTSKNTKSTNTGTGLTQNTINKINNALNKLGKDKVISIIKQAYENGKINKTQYLKSMKYITYKK